MTGSRARRLPGAANPDLGVVTFPSAAELRRRVPRLALGLVGLGFGVAMMINAHLGVSPWDVLHLGIAHRTGLSFGAVVVGVGFVVLLGWIPLRQRLGIGTVINTLVVGWIADGALSALPSPTGLAWRIGLLASGVVVVGIGIGLYIGSGLGPGPRDGLMTGIAARGHPLWLVRMGLELSALAVGWVLGGDVGVGTLVFALGIGPLGHFFLARFHLAVVPAGREPDAITGE